MSADYAAGLAPPAHTHDQATHLLRRPFAPGAVGFRAMSKVAWGNDPYGGAQVAAYIGAQSVLQRLNHVVPGRWRMSFAALDGALLAAAADGQPRRKLYLTCRLHVTLPEQLNGPDVEVVYEDIGECDAGSLAGLKALYSDARKRAGVAAGIGAYLYTALAALALPLGDGPRQVRCLRRNDKNALRLLSPAPEPGRPEGSRQRMSTEPARRALGPILPHGEPDDGIGQGESTDAAARDGHDTPTETATVADPAVPTGTAN